MIFKDIDEIGAECARLRTEEKNIQHYFIMAKKPPCECIVIESRKLYELLRNASVAIDAERVRHGHWISDSNTLFYGTKKIERGDVVPIIDGSPICSCHCSVCSEWLVASDEYAALGKYCPNCGAKMDEENKNACNKRNA